MNVFINAHAVERVTAGAAFLDEHWPNWWMEVELEMLDLTSPCNCVLGQLGRDYSAIENHFDVTVPEARYDTDGYNLFENCAMPSVGLGLNDMYLLGFESGRTDGVTYEDLQEAWVDIITNRRLAASIV